MPLGGRSAAALRRSADHGSDARQFNTNSGRGVLCAHSFSRVHSHLNFIMKSPLPALTLKATLASAAVAASTLLSASMASAATPVDLELFLSLDNSGSIDPAEYALQRGGYVSAFQDPTVKAAIASKPNGVAVALGQWSTTAQAPTPLIGWSLLKTAADADAFALAISGLTQFQSGSTCVACGINAAVAALQANNYQGPSVIDVSGDGSQNQNPTSAPITTAAARDAAAAAGIKINGLPILGSESGLEQWYIDNVKTADGFVTPAASFTDFDKAVQRKIVREISGETVPGPLPILGGGLAFGFSRRLRRRIQRAGLA